MFRKLYLSVSAIFMFSSSLAATFGGPGNDHGYHVIRTSDNGIAVLGQIENQSADFFLIKLDSSLNVQWTKSIGDTSQYDYPYHLCQTNDGGYLIAGGNLNTLTATLVRLNSSGDTIWTHSYGTDPNSIYTASYSEQYSSGQLTVGIIAGTFTGPSSLYLCRTDSSGNITDTLGIVSGGESVLPVSGGYLITGTIDNLTPAAITLTRIDSTSLHSFTKNFFDANLSKELWSYSSAVSGSGFLSAGWTNLFTADPNDYEFYLLQTDADGDSAWSKHWGTGHSELNDIITSGNFFYACGYTEINSVRNNLLMKLDSSGDTIWTKNLGSSLSAFSLLDYSNGYFIATGDSLDSLTGLSDIWLMMSDSMGNFVYNTTTSIPEVIKRENGIELNPAVATDFIRLTIKEYNSGAGYRAIIIDSSGKSIEQRQINSNVSNIDVRNYRPGTYFLRVTDVKGKLTGVKKFHVQTGR